MDPETWITLSQNQNQMFNAIDKFLVRDDRPKVRQGVSRSIVGTLKRPMRNDIIPCEGFAKYFWQILDTLLVQDSISPDSSAEFYHAALVIFQFLGNTDAASLELDHYLRTWSSRLIEYPITEIVGRPKEDYILTGLSKLLSQCTALARDQAISVGMKVSERIFERLLFPAYLFGDRYQDIEAAERLPCLHGPTRTEIYSLLLELVNDLESSTRMVALNRQLFPKEDPLHDSHIADRTRWARSSAGHVGLQNMSNTCYLNSLIAQLFMNRSFRAFILDMDANPSDEAQRLLFSMKVLFARMQNSYAKAVEPKDFVESITDYEGEQIDITIQMDVDEFYNLVFDRLEGQMSSMQMKSSFRGYYGGQLVQQVKSSECEHISERNEPFSAIQCDIKGKTNLQESLKAYVGGEHMDGDNKYSCTECGRHVNAVKRTSLKDLPNGIIFHLKRFEFDLQTMHRSKINDKFEFPNCIDMTPYTTDFLSAEEKGKVAPLPDIFELVGVLVHSGTAESGHYYSYVRDRLSDSANPQWLEFNDSEVSFFDPSTIPSACYGGCDSMARDSMGQTFTVNKPYSAYMLFYERSSFLRSPSGNLGTVGFGRKLPLPHDLECEIQAENERFIRKYCMFDSSYIDFVKKLADQHHRLSKTSTRSEHLAERKALLLALETFEQIATRFKDPGEAEALHSTIHTYLLSCPDCCLDFLNWISDKEEAVRNLLVCNPYPKPRQAVARLVLVALTQLRRKRPGTYGADEIKLEHDYDERGSDSTLYKVCSALIESWDGLQYTAKTWNDYFGLLANIACLGQFEKSTMLELGCLKKTLQLLVIDHLPAPKKKEFMFDNFTKIWSKRRPPIGNAGSLLCELMSLCDPNLLPCLDDDRRIIDERCGRFPLTRTEYDLFTFSDDRNAMTAVTRLLESHSVNDAMANLVSNIVASEVAPMEGGILDLLKYTLINGVPVDPAQEALPFLTCLTQFVACTRSPNYVREIVRRVAEEIPTIGTDGGAEHLAFFQDLLKVRNPVIKTSSTRLRILEQIGSWAPPLLVYCEVGVREETELFLNEILFDTLANGDRPKSRTAVEMLMDNCFTYLETRYTKQRHQCDEKTFESILRVLEKCGEYQSDEEVFKARYDSLRVLIEKMILEEEEDADLASDEWGGSEIGSDTHEMEVQLDEYNSA
ncbi:unnamed protein product [Tuber melanosporum]|uniref:(Perigord truffle) hypothetical protein n=1 Tax=Tuber melanosporum (strain Mel28) TaxID=656061 RepID=D5GBF5_TUBMM|nr:uncharacterized protein GSTUM_00000448001 [Tuber melanosporum]CAZ81848.1 unnamed protein product [Tuber melanosporum]